MKISGVALGELECERKNETLDVLFRLQIDRICEEHIKRLETEIDKLKRERDAAVMDLAKYGDCDACKKAYTEEISCLKPCEFEWRGVCAENSGGDADA